MDKNFMTEFEQREADLLLCLQYSSWLIGNYFTEGERIMINQERGALFEARSAECETPKFVLTGELAMKVEKTLSNIRFLNWKPELLNKQFKY